MSWRFKGVSPFSVFKFLPSSISWPVCPISRVYFLCIVTAFLFHVYIFILRGVSLRVMAILSYIRPPSGNSSHLIYLKITVFFTLTDLFQWFCESDIVLCIWNDAMQKFYKCIPCSICKDSYFQVSTFISELSLVYFSSVQLLLCLSIVICEGILCLVLLFLLDDEYPRTFGASRRILIVWHHLLSIFPLG